MKIVGLVGRAQSGKTTIGKHLVKCFGFKRMSFADALKDMIINAGLCTHDEVYVQKTPESRRMLQIIGTEIFRKQVHPDFWVQKVAPALRQAHQDNQSVVFDDIRFPNEAKLIRSYLGEGILVKVEREDFTDATAGKTHESESLVDSIETHHIIRARSGEVDKLFERIEQIIGERP